MPTIKEAEMRPYLSDPASASVQCGGGPTIEPIATPTAMMSSTKSKHPLMEKCTTTPLVTLYEEPWRWRCSSWFGGGWLSPAWPL
ncbi:hypothetical protein AB0G85_38060 [Streptomyces sioyaensis]|uniref:hypothetical protein n=1 Tax=Streptomyces sioyaensis TaxID=67364 RepID=UPI00340C9996